jgi:hypothetical protein
MSNEQHWLTTESPASLLHTAKQLDVLRPRKRLLFACGCYRLVWEQINLAHVRETVERVEQKADRKGTPEDLRSNGYVFGLPTYDPQNLLQLSLSSLVTPKMIPTHIAWLVRTAIDPTKHDHSDKWENCKPQADLARDIIGNPFRPVAFDPEWRTSTAVLLARRMYDARDFAPMPVLADALQDAGCEHADILAHCRGPGPHVRGCWVVDLVLGKA